MPFGLKNAPAIFQRVMNLMFYKRLNKGVMVYVDDVVVYGKTFDELLDNLSWTLK